MSIKTPKRIVLAVIASLVVAPLVAVAPANAANVPVSVVSTTLATATRNVDVAQTISISGATGATAMITGDTVSFTLSLTVPTGSDVALDDKDGNGGGNIYSNGQDALLDEEAAPNVINSGSRVTLTAESNIAQFTELDLGDLTFTPDVIGDYVFTINSTNANGDPVAGLSVTRTVTIVAVTTTVNALTNAASSYELDDHVGSAYVCYTDTNASDNTSYYEYVYTPSDNEFYINSLTDLSDITNGSLRLTISGPAIWNDEDGTANEVISNGGKVATIAGEDVSLWEDEEHLHFYVSGTGTVTVTIQEVLTSGVTRSAGTFTVDSVATCTNNIFDADESGVRVQANAVALTEKPIADVSGASTVARGGTGFIAVYLADVNGDLITGATNTLTATSTAAVTLGWNGIGTLTTASIVGDDASDAVLFVRAATTGTILSAPVEIKLNGTLVATKTISFTGPADKIEVSAKKTSIATSATTAEAFKVRVKDSAGNGVTSGGASVFTVDGTYVTSATAAAASATAASAVSVTCSALRGKGSVTLAWGLLGDKREVVEVICAGGIATFEVTTSKSAFERAEIGVLTISAKDLAGNPVPDGTALATAAGKIQFTGSGATLAKSPAATDTFADGKIDYAFTTSATAGSYNFALWHGDLSPAVTKIATFTVNAAAVAPSYTKPTLKSSVLAGRVLLFGACEADEGDMVVYVKSPGKPWQERAKTLECVAGEYEGSLAMPKSAKYFRVKQEGTGLWSGSVLVRP